MLRREFKGTLVVVHVLQDGFQYQDRFYKSLSAIARQVTGTPWNGYDFFRISQCRVRTAASNALRYLHPEIYRGGSRSGVHLARCPERYRPLTMFTVV
jgi:hypothetical protein